MFKEKLEEILKKQTQNRVVPELKDLPHPSELKNCVKAAKAIINNLMNGKRMLVVGDYDADGIMATTIIITFLREVGFTEELVDYIIPSRLKDGYGLSPNIIRYAKEKEFDFIVSVDNGISAVEAIDLANELGINVIITDHHTAPKVLPKADIIVNPRVPGETFPFTMISGATVAWYLVAALRIELGIKIDIRKYLDFVAITIISDVMPLDNLNLPLLKEGLKQIKERKRFFYKLVWNDWTAPTINETEIGFSLVPMINAIGRIEDANIGVKLFVSKSQEEIQKLYFFLKETNEKRKDMSRYYVKEAEAYIKEFKSDNKKVIVVRNKDFHEGIVGIIAGKLAEKYQRPAYVFSYNEEKGLWKGSARSYGNIHLYDLTCQASDFIAGFGGHKGAVGLGVKESSWKKFESALNKAAKACKKEDFLDTNTNVIECSLHEVNHDVIEILAKYGPYGQGNPEPIFKTSAEVKVLRELKGGLHYKTQLTSEDTSVVGLFFNVEKDDFLEKIDGEEESDILFYPSLKFDLRNEKFDYEFICTLI